MTTTQSTIAHLTIALAAYFWWPAPDPILAASYRPDDVCFAKISFDLAHKNVVTFIFIGAPRGTGNRLYISS